MTPEDVRSKMEQYLSICKKEKKLKLELCALDFSRPMSHEISAANSQREKDLIAAIGDLRQEELVPILRELAEYIAAARSTAEQSNAKG